MTAVETRELLLLHALPLDGSMWARQMDLLPGSTYAPTLYPLGDCIQAWAAAVLTSMKSDRLIVVGCSIGGSCALEVATAAPDRVAALVLIGTKAGHRRDAPLHASALQTLREQGLAHAWRAYWEPLFSRSACSQVIEAPSAWRFASHRRKSHAVSPHFTAGRRANRFFRRFPGRSLS